MILPSDASSDQSNCPPDYYRRNTGMLHQIGDTKAPEHVLPEIDTEDPAALRTLAKTRLIEIIRLSAPTTALVPAIKELLDRVDGKAAQSIAMTVEDKGLGKLSTERLLRLEAELARITGVEAMVIAPMPQKLLE
jgi:hypothetical protein